MVALNNKNERKIRSLVIKYKNILLILAVIWMGSFAYFRSRSGAAVKSIDPNRVRNKKDWSESDKVINPIQEIYKDAPADINRLIFQSWGQDVCGYPLPHDYQAPFGCILNSIQREGEAVSHSFLPSARVYIVTTRPTTPGDLIIPAVRFLHRELCPGLLCGGAEHTHCSQEAHPAL